MSVPRLINDPEFLARKEAFAGGNITLANEPEGEDDPPELAFRAAEVLRQEPVFFHENPNGTLEHGLGVLVVRDGYYFTALTEVHLRDGRHTFFHSVASEVCQEREAAEEVYEEFIQPCREEGGNYWGRRR